jgi:hypothetical protein
MHDTSEPVIYQLKVVLLGVSPMIWRRLAPSVIFYSPYSGSALVLSRGIYMQAEILAITA